MELALNRSENEMLKNSNSRSSLFFKKVSPGKKSRQVDGRVRPLAVLAGRVEGAAAGYGGSLTSDTVAAWLRFTGCSKVPFAHPPTPAAFGLSCFATAPGNLP